MSSFATAADYRFLGERGIGADEARRQWALLEGQPRRVVLERPCTAGDGIEQLPEGRYADLRAAHRRSAAAGRWRKFVPASGAASRMFTLRAEQDRRQFGSSIRHFAFAGALRERLARGGRRLTELLRGERFDELLDAVIGPAGLGYGQLPKGLVAFHRYRDGTRTPFEEHLLEILDCLGDAEGRVAAHFTVAAEHRGRFARQLERFQSERTRGRCQVDFSVQHPATDTLGRDGDGGLLRDDEGRPVLRPGGHGALIENLNELQGDLIFVKNIDNVCHRSRRAAAVQWIQLLGGYAVRLQAAIQEHLRALRDGGPQSITAARDFVRLTFPGSVRPGDGGAPADRQRLVDRLDRPLRVCGMVRNQGEPGGGPFWIRQASGDITLQIVETAEVDLGEPQQAACVRQATHFNPVLMALAVRDMRGEPYDLRQFVDPRRAIITEKSVGGRTATVLERPGLWNGGMAGWNSVFVEVPAAVFAPVKTVLDLLRAPHQPPAGALICSRPDGRVPHGEAICQT